MSTAASSGKPAAGAGAPTAADIDAYVQKRPSDYGFELAVLSQMSHAGFDCLHSGTYDDPAQNKPRQYDIRATRTIKLEDGSRFTLRAAVECKNVREQSPVIVFTSPRRAEESFNDAIWTTTSNAGHERLRAGRAR